MDNPHLHSPPSYVERSGYYTGTDAANSTSARGDDNGDNPATAGAGGDTAKKISSRPASGKEKLANITAQWKNLMAEGKRVIAVADLILTSTPDEWKGSDLDNLSFSIDGLELSGLFGLEDPPKVGVRSAISKCKAAGVKVVMVTGDHPDTARAIAGQLGILNADAGGGGKTAYKADVQTPDNE